MKKTSIASLKERLGDWTIWYEASYQLGACLGFWPEFGAPGDASGPFDPYHGVKDTIWHANSLSDALSGFLLELIEADCLEARNITGEPEYRWNPNYKGAADLETIL